MEKAAEFIVVDTGIAACSSMLYLAANIILFSMFHVFNIMLVLFSHNCCQGDVASACSFKHAFPSC